MNALSATTLSDLIEPLYKYLRRRDMSDRSGLILAKSLGEHDDVIKWKHFRVTGPLCGEFTGPGEFPTQRPVARNFDVFFDLRPNKRLSKQP